MSTQQHYNSRHAVPQNAHYYETEPRRTQANDRRTTDYESDQKRAQLEEAIQPAQDFNAFWRLKLVVHLACLFFIIPTLVCGFLSLAKVAGRPTRANTYVLGMAAKSIAFVGYQLATMHIASLKRWKSLKAYAILNCLELVFWLAALVLLGQVIGRQNSKGKIISGVAMGCSIVLWMLSAVAAFISIRNFRYLRTYGVEPK